MSKGHVRRIRLRGVVAFPAVSVALVVSAALALSPFGPGQGMALAASPTPTQTSAPVVPPAAMATSAPTTAETTTAAPTTSGPTTSGPTSGPTTSDPTTTVPTTAAPPSILGPVPNPVPGTDPSLAAALAAAPVGHHVLAQIGDTNFQATYLAVDAPVTNASQFQSFRVRFQVGNTEATPVTANPRLEYRALDATDFVVVPDKPTPGVAFHAAREWAPNTGAGGGMEQGPLGADIAVGDLLSPSEFGTAAAAVGHHSMGANPDQPITLAPNSYSEQEFTVGLTIDATYQTSYELRITDGGAEMAGTSIAEITLGSAPLLWLSPNQREGVTVTDPTAPRPAGAAYPLLSANTQPGVAAPGDPKAPQYALASGSLSPANTTSSAASVASSDIHGPYSTTADQCGVCHRGHTAQAPNLLAQNQQSTLCLSCHDGGMGATTDVRAQYAIARPSNNPAAREYYSHDALTSTTPPPGEVNNRRVDCSDCHNSHKARGTDSAQTATGWDASGRLAGVSGVAVVNGEPDTQPTYTPLDGVGDVVTREYQLCFKCHSGASDTLTSNAGLKASQYALDKGVELNPANPSFHPVEAAGKNDTAKMTDSLGGTSPYKRWNFNTASTVRCLNCHAGGAPEPTAPAVLPPPGSSLAPHASSNRGILLENYMDRELKPRTDTATATAAYSAGDFGLCYVCHAEAPFANKSDPADGSSNATNFKLHGLHLTGLAGKGTGGTEIDTAGDGQGNATCAECHFRIHSTTNKVGPQDIPGSRLVNFAPNVQGSGGAISWAPGTTGSGSCTLTCHGYEHKGSGYSG